MKQLIPMDDYGIFCDSKDTARANSLMVAKMFGKRHDNVLRDIETMECSKEFRLLNFEESSYKNEQGKKQPCVNMTRDGFTFLVMGYRGKKAAQFKEAYILRFNQMEKYIQTMVETRTQFPLLTDNIKLLHENPRPYHSWSVPFDCEDHGAIHAYFHLLTCHSVKFTYIIAPTSQKSQVFSCQFVKIYLLSVL